MAAAKRKSRYIHVKDCRAPVRVYDPSAPCRCGTGMYCHRHRTYGVPEPSPGREAYDPPPSRFLHRTVPPLRRDEL